MLVVTRHRVDGDSGEFLSRARAALAVLAARPGFETGRIGRALDDPTLWVITTRWQGVGAYRRALSAYDVKLGAVPLLSTAIDEPSAFELLDEVTADTAEEILPGLTRREGRSDRASDAELINLGDASNAHVPTDLPGR